MMGRAGALPGDVAGNARWGRWGAGSLPHQELLEVGPVGWSGDCLGPTLPHELPRSQNFRAGGSQGTMQAPSFLHLCQPDSPDSSVPLCLNQPKGQAQRGTPLAIVIK